MKNYELNEKFVKLDKREVPLYGEYDVVVVGGGMAGVGAAVAAAKMGMKTIIIENTSALGGISTMGIVNICMDFVSGIGDEFFKELDAIDGLRRTNTHPEKQKLTLDRLVKKYGVEVLFVTPLVDTLMEDNAVKGIVIHTKKGDMAVMGKRFVDASGDSDLVYFAGGETMTGRDIDNMSMGCSLDFILGGVDIGKYRSSELFKTDPQWKKLIAEKIEEGSLEPIDNHLNWMTYLPGVEEDRGNDMIGICMAHSRNCFPTENTDLTRMYFEGREQAEYLAKWIKENIPGFEHSYLSQTGSLLGVRESRRIVGEYIFSGMDIATAKKFDDVIAISQHGFDLHGFEGPGNMKWFKGTLPDGEEVYVSNRAGWGSQMPPEDGLRRINMKELLDDESMYCYDIPYRSILPVRLDNVLAAGRNISADIPGQSGTRLVMCCMSLGEAAGTACALSIKEGVTPRELNVGKLQRTLVDNKYNIGQAFRKIPGLEEKDYSEFNVINRTSTGNG